MHTAEIFLRLIHTRQSVRSYSDKSVEPDKIARCLEAARLSPSACNAQPWTFIVINDPDLKTQIANASADKLLPLNHFAKQAPLIVAVVMEKPNLTSKLGELIKDKKFTLIDIGIAASNFCLQAHAEGLGTCMLGWFAEDKIKKILHIPKNKRLVLLITVGYPGSSKQRTKIRKSVKEIIRYNRYDEESAQEQKF
jgi:nitroreductase